MIGYKGPSDTLVLLECRGAAPCAASDCAKATIPSAMSATSAGDSYFLNRFNGLSVAETTLALDSKEARDRRSQRRKRDQLCHR